MSLISFFLKHAIQSPDAIALKFCDEILTYHELACRVKAFADHLAKSGVSQDNNVAIYLCYSPKVIICVLAMFALGITFIPVDPDYPEERKDYILKNCRVSHVITETDLMQVSALNGIKKINMDAFLLSQKIELSDENFAGYVDENSSVYILYTSGSTGKPKGVVITQGGLIDTFLDWQAVYALNPTDKHLQMASYSFDVFYGDLMRALFSGACLVLCPRPGISKPRFLFEIIESEQITIAEFVPSVLRNLVNYLQGNQKNFSSVRLIACGSDNWSIGEYKIFKTVCNPETRLINSYGLTEATIDSCYFELTPQFESILHDQDSVPIGKPFPSAQVVILDDQLNPVAGGEVGQIFISGSSVAQGYYNDFSLTSKRFVVISVNGKSVRFLKTGDLGRLIAGGAIQLVGREDNQIKLNGLRVEMSDIENNLNLHPKIQDNIVALQPKKQGKRCLVAYIVVAEDAQLSDKELRDFLKTKIPYYMIPKSFIRLEKIPLTPNGKHNRQFFESDSSLFFDNLLFNEIQTA